MVIWALTLSMGFLTDVPRPRTDVGIASYFKPVEKHNNGIFACAGRTPMLPYKTHREWKDPEMPICASRTIPCGTWVYVENLKTKDTTWCMVADRGPYGAKMPNGKWVVKRPGDPKTKAAKYRGIIDLSPRVMREAGTKGWGRVRIRWWPKSRQNKLMKEILNRLNRQFIRDWH